MLFYDFEVFAHDWLVVVIDPGNRTEKVIINDRDELAAFYREHRNDIWVGWNSRHYDQYILKGILAGFDPKKINDWIIERGNKGWTFSNQLRAFPFNNYDIKNNIDRGLKVYEGFMGHDIRESSVPFDIDRPLTDSEIAETVKYCRHDVEQTIEIFIRWKSDFEAHFGLLKMFDLPLSDISKTPAQLAAQILEARKRTYRDEFDIDLPPTLDIRKYTEVVEWYQDPANRKYRVNPNDKKSKNHQLCTLVAGVPHTFGWGGIHGAHDKYAGKGWFLNMDVASLYPSLMIEYDLHSRSCNPERYREIRDKRLAYKAERNPLQAPLKLVLNSTYGAMKDQYNPLYDPRQANRVCVYGQLLLLDLIEKLEPHCEIIQSNTDGVLVRLRDYNDYDIIDDVAHEWEQRTRLTLEFEEFTRVYQGDVNNYVIVAADGSYTSKGAYVKKLHDLDYDLPIVNRAIVDYLVKGVPVSRTVEAADDLRDFQMVARASQKFVNMLHGEKVLDERCVRIFASTDVNDQQFFKTHTNGSVFKVSNCPDRAFSFNDDVTGAKVPAKLDRQWYVDLAKARLKAKFGLMV